MYAVLRQLPVDRTLTSCGFCLGGGNHLRLNVDAVTHDHRIRTCFFLTSHFRLLIAEAAYTLMIVFDTIPG